MTTEELQSLKVGQIIYSNQGGHPVEIVGIPATIEFGSSYVVKDIPGGKHTEPRWYIKKNFGLTPDKANGKVDTGEKIKVMQAYLDDKAIQIRHTVGASEWIDMEDKEPSWDWNVYVYRVKPTSKIRPYKDAKEFLQAQKEHGQYLKTKGENLFCLPTVIHDSYIATPYNKHSYKNVADYFDWQDGTPCGITEE